MTRLRGGRPGAGIQGPIRLAIALLAASACGVGPGASPGPPGPFSAPRVVAVHEPHSSAVAAAFVFPGSAWELPGLEGLTLLTAETLLESARGSLDRLGARAGVECDRAAFTFTLVAPVQEWPRAVDALLDALFRPEPHAGALEAARGRLRTALALDRANPAWQARLAIRQALHGDTLADSPWSGPGCGVAELLPLFDLNDVRVGANRFAPWLARAAVVGPVDPEAARDSLVRRIPAPDPPPPLPAPRGVAAGLRYVERNTVTAWLGVAFPFAPDADEEALGYLGVLLEDAFGPDVSRPEVYAISHELERHGQGGALMVHLVTEPGAAVAYADAIERRVADVAEEGVPAPVWDQVATRHRGRRLLERETPESRAAAIALDLALGRAPGDGWPSAVMADAVRAAAGALGAPARSFVGPRDVRPVPP